MKNILLAYAAVLVPFILFSQCPDNINFAKGDLSNWSAYTGNFFYAPASIKQTYPAGTPAPAGTTGANTINEYNNPATGILVNNINTTDPFGFFKTIPTINGYNYTTSLLLGSTTITDANAAVRGGYLRGISYLINVPAGPPAVPYTVTYAYAMVLENGKIGRASCRERV